MLSPSSSMRKRDSRCSRRRRHSSPLPCARPRPRSRRLPRRPRRSGERARGDVWGAWLPAIRCGEPARGRDVREGVTVCLAGKLSLASCSVPAAASHSLIFYFLPPALSLSSGPPPTLDVESTEEEKRGRHRSPLFFLSFPAMDADLLPVLSYGGIAATAAAGTSHAKKRKKKDHARESAWKEKNLAVGACGEMCPRAPLFVTPACPTLLSSRTSLSTLTCKTSSRGSKHSQTPNRR